MTTTHAQRSRTSARIPKAVIDQSISVLLELPDKSSDVLQLSDRIESIYSAIAAVLKRGYSHEEVIGLLREEGLEISLPALKYRLTRINRNKKKRRSTAS